MFFGREESPIEAMPVLDADEMCPDPQMRHSIVVCDLSEYPHVHNVLRAFNEDKICMIRLGEPISSDSMNLGNALKGLRQACLDRGGRMLGLDGAWLLMLPENVDLQA